MIPIPLPWRILMLLALLASGVAFGWIKGAASVQADWQLADAKARAEQVVRIHTITRIINRETVRYLDRVVEIHDLQAGFDKEVPNYVNQDADAACMLPVGFVLYHNAAAEGRALEGGDTGSDHAAASQIPLSAAARTIADNYWRGNQNAEQVIALQEVVKTLRDGCR
ncbi:MAG: hypothetical protein AB1513_11350 [Pseudomonadota bacterium]